jgi:hypothetical protein
MVFYSTCAVCNSTYSNKSHSRVLLREIVDASLMPFMEPKGQYRFAENPSPGLILSRICATHTDTCVYGYHSHLVRSTFSSNVFDFREIC